MLNLGIGPIVQIQNVKFLIDRICVSFIYCSDTYDLLETCNNVFNL